MASCGLAATPWLGAALKSLFSEFKRRNVFRVAVLYLVSAWLIAQVADVVIGLGELPPATGQCFDSTGGCVPVDPFGAGALWDEAITLKPASTSPTFSTPTRR